MAIGYITRIERFSSAHRLNVPQLSKKENFEIFGKCNHINGHGHNYTLKVTVKGTIDPVTGMIVNISDLKAWIKEDVLQHLDHKNIDLDVEYFHSKASTAENLTVFIWETLSPRFKGIDAKLYEIELYETDLNIARYKGE
ncbi:hypothetical protein DSO57_1028149 [Entomophthora muscae]|uniref:Uncharacterized protein n=1 Tax=Entomophthora muscae TaxID=34485 RepID=A0ACC2SEM8_9FUNG|nr:hypothetical protein DSO57_1028149 [Entomophthora muscae]